MKLTQEQIDFAGRVIVGYFMTAHPNRVSLTRPYGKDGGGINDGYSFELWAAARVEEALVLWESSPVLRKTMTCLLEEVYWNGKSIRSYGSLYPLLNAEVLRFIGKLMEAIAAFPMPKEFERV
jgi:hypothetical protein